MTPLSAEEMYIIQDIDRTVIPVCGSVSGKRLPTEKTIIRNVCGGMGCDTAKEVFYNQQFFVAAEDQSRGVLYFNFPQLGPDKRDG